MRVVLVGFPYCGKSTLFQAISGLERDHLRLSEENLAAVKVPEPRLDWLEEIYKPKKRTEATMDFVDLPGSTEGESDHAGLTRHLPTLRQADALLLVLRSFESPSVPAPKGGVDPQRDLKALRDEMLLADLVICDNRVEKLEKAIQKPSKERDQQKHELELLKRCRTALEAEKPLTGVIQPGEEEKLLRSFGFLTQKPLVATINVGERDISRPSLFSDEHAAATINVCAPLEADIIQLDPAERPAFMGEYGIQALARDRIIRACYDALGMIAFLTAGEDEVRAWPIPRGATAVEAAGKIHSDLARGFIRAETVAYDDLRAAGSMRDAKAANHVRQEPKHYVVKDGDILNIKFAV
ncbi:MAG: redox-regulated ATPase YchF [Phycisphaerales bacterium]|nr:redox-regulated ATPase YchF [Phycisphaerales bacterium]